MFKTYALKSRQPKSVVSNGLQCKGHFVAGKGRPSPVVMVVSKMNKDAQMKAAINHKLIETGERECLKELLRAKLTECGWKDQLKAP